MKCFYCGNDFEIISTNGGGGHNRLFCYNCVPEGLSQTEREKIVRGLIINKVKQERILIGCNKCGYNKCASALEWHHPDGEKVLTQVIG